MLNSFQQDHVAFGPVDITANVCGCRKVLRVCARMLKGTLAPAVVDLLQLAQWY